MHHDFTWEVVAENGGPVVDALITVDPDPGNGGTRLTDGNGRAHFGAPFNIYLVRVTKTGFVSWEDTVAVGGPMHTVVTLRGDLPPPPDPPHGRVRLHERVFTDDDGPRPMVGASLFWLAWGYKHDRDRLAQNLQWLAERDVDFVRAFAEVCARHGYQVWADREVDPEWPDYADVIQGSTRLAMAHGLRVEWTLFAGGCYDTPHEWLAAGGRMIDALRPVLDGVQFVEVTNEEQLPDRSVVRELARRVRDRLGIEVALTSPYSDYSAWYDGSAATLGTYHPDRAYGDYGWRFARQMWGYPDELGSGLPRPCVNNEPIGIDSSVRPESDPVKLASDALVTWVSGCAAYVWHSGAGIFGRFQDDGHGRVVQANVYDQPEADAGLRLIDRVRDELPNDLPNWSRANNGWTAPNPVPPFRFTQDDVGEGATAARGVVRSYSALRGDRFCTVVLGARGALTTTPTRPVTATIWNFSDWVARPWTGRVDGPVTTYLVIGR